MNQNLPAKSVLVSSAGRITHTRRALILDDEPDVADILARMLSNVGFSVTCTHSADDFFAAASLFTPDLMVIDLFLPNQDGLEVLRELGSDCKSQIIVTSGASSRILESVRQAAEAYGLDVLGTLEKPYRTKDVRAIVLTTAPCTNRPTALAMPARAHIFSQDELQRALDTGEFRAHFQPQISTWSKSFVGFECLVRWEHTTRGLLSPGTFLPSMESANLMAQLTESMTVQACKFMAGWSNLSFYVAVNAPMNVCSDPSFLISLENALQLYNLKPSRLVIEVTEAGDSELSQAQINQLTRIRMHGFRLSLDDFGTGQSSLHRLVKIPFDELKIEKSFIDNCLATEEARQIVRALVALAKALGMSVVAEGVEDSAAIDLMRQLGCDVVQGYYIGRALTVAEAKEWIMRNCNCCAGPTDRKSSVGEGPIRRF